MIIESGVIIFVGLLLLAFKLPLTTNLKLLGRPLTVDLTASVLAYVLHYGTFSGIMAAAVAGLMCSGFTSMARKSIGYIPPGKKYIPGWWDMSHKLPQDLLTQPITENHTP